MVIIPEHTVLLRQAFNTINSSEARVVLQVVPNTTTSATTPPTYISAPTLAYTLATTYVSNSTSLPVPASNPDPRTPTTRSSLSSDPPTSDPPTPPTPTPTKTST